MSSFSKTPHLLTKEKLKSALKANGIPLPKTDQKKAFYVDLYLQKLTSQNDEEFSSDESEELSETSPMEASKRLPAKPQQKIVINKRVKGGLPFDVTALSDGDLARQLKSFGATVGPITDSTRPLYQKKLEIKSIGQRDTLQALSVVSTCEQQYTSCSLSTSLSNSSSSGMESAMHFSKLLTEEMQTPAVPPTKVSPKQRKLSPSKRRRKDFSDGNDIDDASAEELEIESVERLNYNHDQQDQLDSPPSELPPPSYRSTPARATPRKRDTRQVYNESRAERANSLKQTDSVENVAVNKPAQPVKEESSICGPHFQILLAVLVFLSFTAFLVYYLMDESPHREIAGGNQASIL